MISIFPTNYRNFESKSTLKLLRRRNRRWDSKESALGHLDNSVGEGLYYREISNSDFRIENFNHIQISVIYFKTNLSVLKSIFSYLTLIRTKHDQNRTGSMIPISFVKCQFSCLVIIETVPNCAN